MKRCFVIQPFDGGDFDNRFDDVLKPAVEAANLEPYRVDRDPGAGIPIERIEKELESAAICLADISTDNPNVWFEVGYAIAARRSICLICKKERDRFPFDVQHRRIIRYGTGSHRDLEGLASEITKQLQAMMAQEEELATLSRPTRATGSELTGHELAALVIMVCNIYTGDGGATAFSIEQQMAKAGYNELATNLAIRSLIKRGYAEPDEVEGNYNHESYTIYKPTNAGVDVIADRRDLELNAKKRTAATPPIDPPPVMGEEDIPF